MNRSAGPVRHKSCLVLAVLLRDAFMSQVCFFGATLSDGSGPKVASAEGWPIGATEESLWVACRGFCGRNCPSFFLFQVNDYNNNGLNHLDVNVHSGFQFLSILIVIDGCWLASQALLRYYARAALLQVQARRVTAKDHLQFPKCSGDWKWSSVGIAGRWTVFNFNSLEIWCLVDSTFFTFGVETTSTLLLEFCRRDWVPAGAFPALARGLCSPARLHGSARQLSWWDSVCHGRNSWCGG